MVRLQIEQDDKFFSRLLSREGSAVSSSRRVYYGSAAASVPFLWESRPGTPKHALSESALPPLSPPPSFAASPHRGHGSGDWLQKKPKPKAKLFCAIFPALDRGRRAPKLSSPSSSSSSSSSSYFSTSSASSSPSWTHRRCGRSMRSGSQSDGEGLGSPASTPYAGAGWRKTPSYKAREGWDSVGSVKKKLLSVVRHG